ncbi:MAG: PEP-CTERM sorting domain-containing protein [Acidobacteriota bacterium]|nr:PEP-CTERM sorting domain-containing protein [Acidobacteriota bacterium]
MTTIKTTLLAGSFMFVAALTSTATTILNFDSVPISSGAGVDATSYLASFGITLSNVTPGPSGAVQIYSDQFITYEGASSPHNFLMQNGGGAPNGLTYTLNFSTALTSLSFVRIAQTAPNAVAQWTATAFAGFTAVGSVGENSFSGTEPAQTYSLFAGSSSGITSLEITANGGGFAGVPSLPMDDLTLNQVPEPSTFVLILGAAAACALCGRKRLTA